MKILVFTTLYPNAVQFRRGIFVQTRLTQLVASGEVRVKVVAPVPWFPFKSHRFGEYSEFARVPEFEEIEGIEVYHPRYIVLPKIGMNLSPSTLYWAAKKTIKNIIQTGFEFDLIDAHYFYPDGVAATKLGKAFNKPVVITARGTDINLLPSFKKPKQKIAYAIECAAGIVTVSSALKSKMVDAFDIIPERVNVFRNGVDLELFKPLNREAIKSELGVTSANRTLLSVGNLVKEKGHDLVIKAMQHLPEYRLFIVGEGPEGTNLKKLTSAINISDRVVFLGNITQERLADIYNMADALVLASSREGWPNVLLESMACGTPVVASDVGGVREIILEDSAGVVMHERSESGIKNAVDCLFNSYPDRNATRFFAERFSWDQTTSDQLKLFSKIINGQ